MNQRLTVDVLDLEGEHYEIGVTQGTLLDDRTVNAIEHIIKPQIEPNKVRKILLSTATDFHQELNGIADGLNQPTDHILSLYSGYGVSFPIMGCSTLAKGGLYVRNYDFSPELYDARLVFTNPKRGFATVGFSQQIVGRL